MMCRCATPLRHAVERSLGDDLDMIGQPRPKPANGLKAPPPYGSRKPSLQASRRGRGHRRRPRHERRGHRRVIQITEAKSTKAANIADATRRARTRNSATKPTESAIKPPIELNINVVRLLLSRSLRSFSRLLLATRRRDLDPLARHLQRNRLGQTPEFGLHPLIQAGKS
jgi:hypothetical protein